MQVVEFLPSAADHPQLGPLGTVKVKKRRRHANPGGFFWNTRWLEYDDDMGILFIYRSNADWQRKTPAHLYPCCDILEARSSNAAAISYTFELQLRRPELTLRLACESVDDAAKWIEGLEARRHQLITSGTHGHGARLLALSTQLPPLDGISSGYARFERFGVVLSNCDGRAIGVHVDALRPGSPLVDAGVRDRDVHVAVDGSACLSHKHARDLLDATDVDVELVVWTPLAARTSPP